MSQDLKVLQAVQRFLLVRNLDRDIRRLLCSSVDAAAIASTYTRINQSITHTLSSHACCLLLDFESSSKVVKDTTFSHTLIGFARHHSQTYYECLASNSSYSHKTFPPTYFLLPLSLPLPPSLPPSLYPSIPPSPFPHLFLLQLRS